MTLQISASSISPVALGLSVHWLPFTCLPRSVLLPPMASARVTAAVNPAKEEMQALGAQQLDPGSGQQGGTAGRSVEHS